MDLLRTIDDDDAAAAGVGTSQKKRPRRKKEIVKAPRRTDNSRQRPQRRDHLINSLLRASSRNTLDSFLGAASSTATTSSSSSLPKAFIELSPNVDEELSEWLEKTAKQNPSLTKTVSMLFTSPEERREFYVLRFLCDVPASMPIFQSDREDEESSSSSSLTTTKDVILDVVKEARIAKKSKAARQSTEKDYVNVRVYYPPKGGRVPYAIVDGKLVQSKRGSNVCDKYVALCIYAICRLIRGKSETNIIMVRCLQSTAAELSSPSYYCLAIKEKYMCFITSNKV